MAEDILFEQFDLLADTPGGVQKLRELILQLAVQGKLVPQKPEEEPASVLLDRIKEEKERLVREGKIKKQKPLPEIKPEEEPFELPAGWEWVRIGDVTSYGMSEKIAPEFISDEMWVLELEDIEKVTSRLLKKRYCYERKPKSTKAVFHRGNVIYGKLRPYLDKVIIADENGVCTTEMIPLEGFEILDNNFIRWFLKSPDFISYANDSTHGMNLPRLGTEKARLGLMPIPPLSEQHRIVAKVDQLMTLCDELEAKKEKQKATHARLNKSALQALRESRTNDEMAANWARVKNNFRQLFTTPESVQELRSTILQLAVQGKLVPQNPEDEPASALLERIREEKQRLVKEGKIKKQKPLPEIKPDEVPFELPEGWEWVRLNGIFRFIDYRGKTPPKTANGIRLVTAKNVRMGYLDINPEEFISVETYEQWMTRGLPIKGDILFTTEAPLANVCLFNFDEKIGLAQRIINLQLFSCKDMARYCLYAFMSPPVQWIIKQQATGMTAKGIKAARLKDVCIPIPPIQEQDRIVAKVDQLMGLCDELEASLSQSQADGERLMSAVVEEISGGRQKSDAKLRNPTKQSPDEVASNTNHRIVDTAPTKPQPANSAHSNPEPSTAGSNNPESDKSKANNTAAAILAYMQPGEQYTRSDIMDALRLSVSAWNTGIRELKEHGYVVQTGQKRGARYKLSNP